MKLIQILALALAVALTACAPQKLSIAPINCVGCLPAYPDMQREDNLMRMQQNAGNPHV